MKTITNPTTIGEMVDWEAIRNPSPYLKAAAATGHAEEKTRTDMGGMCFIAIILLAIGGCALTITLNLG